MIKNSSHVLSVIHASLYHSKAQPLNALATLHWLCVCQLILSDEVPVPTLVADWDVMMFTNQTKALGGLTDCDVACSYLNPKGKVSQSPILIGSKKTAEAFIERQTKQLVDCKVCDSEMGLWTDIYHDKELGLKVNNLGVVRNGSVFDDNIGADHGEFETEKVAIRDQGTYKRIEWSNGIPHFILKTTRQRVVANHIHCWGAYKSKTGELLRLANEGRKV